MSAEKYGRSKKIIITAAVVLLSMWLVLPAGCFAAAGSLKIQVGYFGGPYYDKASFSVSEVRAMGTEKHIYSYIDKSPSVCIDCAAGVKLGTIMKNAGIDTSAIKRFYFCAGDNYDPDWESSAAALLNTERYYYPKLQEYYTAKGISNTGKASEGAVSVPAILAVTDDWNRMSIGDVFNENWNGQKTDNRFRLLFGQTSVSESMADKAVKYIGEVKVALNGSPSISADRDSIKAAVGGKAKIGISVSAADSVIAENIKKDIKWKSENSSIATVDQSGNVKITGKGETVISAVYGDQQVDVVVNGTKTKKKDQGSGSGSGGGQGTGTGGSGSGTSGNGTGSSGQAAGKATEIVLGKSGKINTQGKSGGGSRQYQVYEMEDVKNQLPKTDQNKYLKQVGLIAGGILVLSMGGEYAAFQRKLRGIVK